MGGFVLVALDGTASSQRAVGPARALAWKRGTAVWLASAVARTSQVAGREQSLQQVASLIREVPVAGVTVTPGDPATVVTGLADELRASAVCLATRAYRPELEVILGSTTTKVLRRSRTPVLLTGPSATPRPADAWFEHVVVGVDGSRRSEAALPIASQWAAELDAQLHLVRVLTPADERLLVATGMPVWDLTGESYSAVEQSGVVSTFQVVRDGHIAAPLAGYAAALPGAMLVLATRGRSALHRAVVGSVAGEVVHRARCPVLLLHAHAPDRALVTT